MNTTINNEVLDNILEVATKTKDLGISNEKVDAFIQVMNTETDPIVEAKEQAREARARREAKKQGYIIKKSRAKNWTVDNQQGYMILDAYSGIAIDGARFDWTLEHIEAFLQEKDENK